jgi:hypothetical protein
MFLVPHPRPSTILPLAQTPKCVSSQQSLTRVAAQPAAPYPVLMAKIISAFWSVKASTQDM